MISTKSKTKRVGKATRNRSASLLSANPAALLALVAHELRNPLAGIQIGLRILEIAPTGPEATHTHALMQRQLDHALHLIEDLLDLSRVEAKQVPLAKTNSFLQDIINFSLESSSASIKRKHHTLKVSLPDTPVILHCDRRRLAQVVINLIDNACKFTPEGGTILLTVTSTPSHVQITVTDNGVGLAPEKMKSIFRPFHQGAETPPGGGGGLGLGLFLVKSFVEAHGGSVVVKSAGQNCGTSFHILLPRG